MEKIDQDGANLFQLIRLSQRFITISKDRYVSLLMNGTLINDIYLLSLYIPRMKNTPKGFDLTGVLLKLHYIKLEILKLIPADESEVPISFESLVVLIDNILNSSQINIETTLKASRTHRGSIRNKEA